MTDQTTVRTSAAKALTDWQEARQAVVLAAQRHANYHTAETKRALTAARQREARLLANYSAARMLQMEAIAAQGGRMR